MFLILRKNGFEITDKLNLSGKYIGERLLHFKIFISGEKTHSPLIIKSEKGEYIDDYLRVGIWENVNINRSPIYEDDSGIYAVVILEDYGGEEIKISDFNADNQPIEGLLAGNTLTQLKPNGYQMMGYIIDTVNGKTVVIDGGDYVDGEALEKELLKRGGNVDSWFITHYHCDHVGAIIKVFENGKIKTDKMYFNFPPTSVISEFNKSDAEYVEKFLSAIKGKVEVITPKRGDRIEIDGITVKVLNEPSLKLQKNFANDTSIVYKVETKKENILFTGDIGDERSEELLADEYFKKEISDCTVVQMSHHGNWGATKNFYNSTSAKYLLYPTPLWLWDNNRGEGKHTSFWTTLETREWMRDMNALKSYTSTCGEDVIIK